MSRLTRQPEAAGMENKARSMIRTIAIAAVFTTLTGPIGTRAEGQEVTIPALLKRIEELEQKVKVLEINRALNAEEKKAKSPSIEELDQKLSVQERKRELETEAAVEQSKKAPRISIDAGGFSASSADTNFVLRLRGGFQLDGRFYPGGATPAKDTFLFRRVRPIVEGTVFGNFDYRLMLDFASGLSSSALNNANLVDAYINYRIQPEFQIQAGKFKEPVGLERLQSWQNLLFVERGLPTLLMPNRDTGVQLQGDIGRGLFQYTIGAFNGTEDGGSSDFDSDSDKDLAARVFAHPFKNTDKNFLKGLGLGISGTWGQHEGALRSVPSPGQQTIFGYLSGAGTNAVRPNVTADGTLWRVSPQGYYYWGPFGFFGEYVVASHELRRDDGGQPLHRTAQHTAWQIAASWFLTGEENSYGRIQPKRNLSPANDGWGALELAARVGELDIDDNVFPQFANPAAAASSIFSWGVGLNWRLNRNVKLSLDYERARLAAAKGANLPFKEEDVIFARTQFGF